MKKLEITTNVKGTVFDSYIKPASEEKKNPKTGEIFAAQPEKYYLQFLGEKVLNQETGDNKKQIVDVRIFEDPKKFEGKDVEVSVNVYQMGANTYYNQVEDSKIISK
jgi:hypothetical protein